MEDTIIDPPKVDSPWIDDEIASFIEPDTVGYGNQRDQLSHRLIVLRHIERLTTFILKSDVTSDVSSSSTGQREKSSNDNVMQRKDSRERIIMGIRWLDLLLAGYRDKKITELKAKIETKINSVEQKVVEISLSEEAMKRVSGFSDEEKTNSYNYWMNFFKDMNISFLDKESPYFEYYLETKFNHYLVLMEELILLATRNNWLSKEMTLGAYD